jgi:hypothetical protein
MPTLGAHCRATVLTSTTPLRAYGTCDRLDDEGRQWHDRLAYFERAPDGWHGRQLPLLGRPLATAQDSTGTYLLYEARDEATGLTAAVLKRDADGHYSHRALSREESVGSGAIVAAAGRWWAVWTCVRGGGREYSLCEAGTLFGVTAARSITAAAAGDFLPSLAWRADGRLDLLWSRVTPTIDGGDYEIRFASTTGHGWTSRRLAMQPNDTLVGQVATDGSHTYAAWIQRGRPVVGSDESGHWRTHAFVTRSCAWSAALAVSSGSVTVVVNQCAPDQAAEDESGRAVTALERRHGRWSTRTLAQTPNNGSYALGVVSRAGRASVLFRTIGWTSYSRTQAGAA